MHRYGLLTNEELKLDYVLGLTLNKFLDKRLQTRIYQEGFQAKSIHQARVLIHQRHIKVGKNLVNANQFLVRTTSEKKINLAPLSPFETKKPSRTSRKKNKGKKEEWCHFNLTYIICSINLDWCLIKKCKQKPPKPSISNQQLIQNYWKNTP